MRCFLHSVASNAFLLASVSASPLLLNAGSNKLFGTYFGSAGRDAAFDYVIVGGGTAGSVVASRLAQNTDATIAIIEAGSFYEIGSGNLSQIPYYSESYDTGELDDLQPLIDWGFVTTPQPQLNGRKFHYAQGKCLGGSSGRNQMIYHRYPAGAYNQWASEVGDESYSWNNMLPFFEKSCNFTIPDLAKRAANATLSYNLSSYSVAGGPLHVSYPNFAMPFSSYATKAFKAINIKTIVDFVSGSLLGSQYMAFTMDPEYETRSSSETSFLQQAIAERASGFQIYVNSMVKKILFDGNKSATGVQVNTAGSVFTIHARKAVILSAGAFHSPQLLMVSGIGPAATLNEHNITIVQENSAVGQKMWDSTNVGGVSFPISLITSFAANDPAVLNEETEAFLSSKGGLLTNIQSDFWAWEKLSNASLKGLGSAVRADLAQFSSDWPEIEYVIDSSNSSVGYGASTRNMATIGLLLTAPVSRGNVTIASADSSVLPIISPNWLLQDTDQKIAVLAYKRARKIWASFSKQGIVTGPETSPGADVNTDEEILASILDKHAGVIHHASSTCKMGRNGDPDAVVDSHGRVFGVQGLRVIDASSFRFTPPGHSQAAVYAHAEKLVADLINGK